MRQGLGKTTTTGPWSLILARRRIGEHDFDRIVQVLEVEGLL